MDDAVVARSPDRTDAFMSGIAHEAGHYVIGHALGLWVNHVFVRAGNVGGTDLQPAFGAFAGWSKDPRRRHRQHRSAYRARIIALLAGAEAEESILGQRDYTRMADTNRC